MVNGFGNILDECIDRILRGESIEQCLNAYPKEATELKPLLQVALGAKHVAAVQPHPELRAKVRYIISAQQAARRTGKKRGYLFGWQQRWATVALVTFLVLLVGGGTIFASANSMPDEPLYAVKSATEQLQLIFTPSVMGKAKLHARFAGKRVVEIAEMSERAEVNLVDNLSLRLSNNLEKVALLAEADLGEKVELSAPPEDGKALEEIPVPSLAPETENVTGLKQSLADDAVKNRKILEQAWQKAPPSAKSAVGRAIHRSNQGYEKALEALSKSEGKPR